MAEHLITTPACPEQCHRCGEWTLAAWVDGGRLQVDPVPLDERAELAALLQHRLTFDAVITGRSAVWLSWRSAHDIGQPRRYVVLAQHRRGCPMVVDLVLTPWIPNRTPAELPDLPAW